jgi:PAS domain S-box-containing protein
MSALVELASYAGYLFLLLTAWSSIGAAWRLRDVSHLNVLFVVGSLAFAALFKGQPGSVRWTFHTWLFLAQPYLAVRLIQQFKEVPAIIERGSIGVAIAGAIALVAWPSGLPQVIDIAIPVTISLLQSYVAVALLRESRRTAGVTAKRLVFASAGACAFGLLFLILALVEWAPSLQRASSGVDKVLSALVLFSYFIAFATPHGLKKRWREAEHSRFLNHTANRDAEARGDRAAEDLNEAVCRSVANVVTLVALPAEVGSTDLVVWASSDPSLEGIPVVPSTGLIGHAYRSGAIASTATDCEPAIADRLRPRGSRVLVAPIATERRTWGIVLVVQRRGSLFPEDDLQLVAQLGRYTATALDHASLVLESRQHERDEAVRQVRETEERMGVLLGSVKDYALYVLDERGAVVTWHHGAEHLFGNTRADVKGGSAGTLFDLTDADFQAHLDQAAEQGHVEFECQCLRHDRSRFTGVTVLRPLDSSMSDRPGFAAVTHDVTVRRALEARLLQSQKLEAVGQLAGGVAHDFNNLLSIIVGNVDVLKTRLPDDPNLADDLKEIVKAAENASSLTQQLLTFSRRQAMPPTPARLSHVLADQLPMLRLTLGPRVEVVTDLSADLAPILAVQGQVESMMLNLALNARDAMPDGGRLTIRTTPLAVGAPAAGLEPGSYAVLEVTDTGIGMDAATRSRIFEPFFTTKGLGRGTGLGLATLYGGMHQMGGTVLVESEPGRGTTFQLYFPVMGPDAA